jgi:hypothetical protein
MRNRKNIDCLTTDELHDLREGVAALYALPASNPNSFARIASFHGGPPVAYCEHGAPGFFTWHRAYMLAFENALRSVACDVALPYWNWSSGPSTGVPAACRFPTYVNRLGTTVPNPLFSGPRAAGGQTSRRPDIDTTAFDDLAAGAQSALLATGFTSFQNSINGVHGGVHVRTGGDMGSVPTASYDPIFYLHHANIDRLWDQWQASHPGALPGTEAALELQPFNRPFSVQWQRGSDMESTTALDYRYLRYCFILPPFKFWEVVRFKWPLDIRKEARAARLVIKTAQMQAQPIEVRAFLNQPDAGVQTRTLGNEAFAGTVAFFGHRMVQQAAPTPEECVECARLGHTSEHHLHVEHAHAEHEHAPPTAERRFDLELDITSALLRTNVEEEVMLKLVAVDGNGNQIPAEAISVEGFDIEID